MHPRPRPFWRLAAVAAVAAWICAAPGAAAADPAFKDLIVGSPSYTSAVGHLCYSADGTVEVACPASSPFISSGGLLGIGTESPAYPLDVSGTVRATSFIGDGSGLTGVVASTGDRIVSGSTYMVADGATGLISITQAGTNTAYFHPQLGLVTVGVSTTGPISGTSGYFSSLVKARGGIQIQDGYVLYWGGGSVAITGYSGNDYLMFRTSNTEAMRIVSSGYVGIGTSAPNASLQVGGTTNGSLAVARSTGAFASFLGSSGDSYLSRFGNLGVGGISAPSATLHVSGTIRMADGGEACDANRTGAIKYSGGDFSICRNGSAWESLSAVAAGAVSVTDGLSGSLVFRDQAGTLHGHPTISVSATTGSVGIGAGAPAGMNSGIYAVGNVYSSQGLGTGTAGMFYFNAGAAKITGDGQTGGNNYMAFTTSNTEAMRIVSSGYVGIGTNAPSSTLHIVGVSGSIGGLTLTASNGGGDRLKIYPYGLHSTGISIGNNAASTLLFLGPSGNNVMTLTSGQGLPGVFISGGSSSIISNPSATLHVSGSTILSSWTMIGANTTPTAALDVSGSIRASGSIKVSGTGGETCTGSADTGRIRVNPVTGRLQLCAPL